MNNLNNYQAQNSIEATLASISKLNKKEKLNQLNRIIESIKKELSYAVEKQNNGLRQYYSLYLEKLGNLYYGIYAA